MNANEVEHRQFLLACAAWQDTLLQSYRTLHVTIQGFLVAAGAAVLAVQLTGAIQNQASQHITNSVFNCLLTALLAFLFWLQRRTSTELRAVVGSRARDIQYWHQKVILAENPLDPEQRVFTHFKVWQQAKRASVDHLLHQFLPSEGISGLDAEQLVGKGTGHTQQVLDINLFQRLQLLWNAVLITSAGVSAWFLAICWSAATT
ncbi:MAG: hypothetical protein K2W80_04465 [Burkholderiales bacterium]|jgi:hypothetical protein|nr:hypothetical protein [Burkholderiales bacterium]